MRGTLHLIAAKDPDPKAVKIHQDVRLFATVLEGETVKYILDPRRYAWIQIASGKMKLNATSLEEGDGAALSQESSIELTGNGEALLFDLV